MARTRTVDRRPIMPGEVGWAVLDCEERIVARVRDRFVLRFYSPVTTVGGGRICRLDPPRAWRREVDRWKEIVGSSEGDAVLAALSLAGGSGVRSADLPIVTGVSPRVLAERLEDCSDVVRLGEIWYDAQAVDAAAGAVVSHLRETHSRKRRESTIPLESLRAGLSAHYSADLLGHVVAGLEREGLIAVEGPGVRLADHEVELSPEEARAERLVFDTLSAAGLAPPSPEDLATRLHLERDLLNDLLGLLQERGEIVRISPDIYVTRVEEERATKIVRAIAAERPSSPGEFRAALGLTRKHLIPLLEHLDRRGVTRRTADGRTVGGA
jgi:selenocysteine-specific elongation factor